ncbi:ABC transporter permease [Desulfosporosinus sp. PR]|uniref:ABC transporter permease n=1 Tax=Candidatus Desulfosporosinus nitrosoreducens TaxID=3401928 RepID=UPI0027EFF056|nr:ABC transporter permease [Desulfosporosinus sp. PR]MDQ7095335.1 ABC transporter permease [Desulfosporosinus sp. PR]
MNVARLFVQRLVAEWKYQYEVWKTAVDWVVALYIVIPFSAIFLNFYRSWWWKAPGWLNYVPLNALLFVVLVFAWSGTIRIFVEDADQLFLLQRAAWFNGLLKYSLSYSLIYNLVAAVLLLLVLAPFLILHYGFSWLNLMWLTVFLALFKNCMGIAKQLFEFRFKGWSQRFVRTVIFVIAGLYMRQSVFYLQSRRELFYPLILGLLFLLGLLLYKRLTMEGIFFEDVSREETAKLRLAKFMLQRAGTYVKKPRSLRKRPLMFRNSNLLFQKRNPVNALTEVCLKALLRNDGDVMFYLQLLGFDLGLILLIPSYYKWLLWLVFSLVMTNLVWLSWREVINEPFVCLFPWLPETKVAAARKALFLMALPGQLILGVAVAIQTGSWLETLAMLPLGIIAGYLTAKRVSLRSE